MSVLCSTGFASPFLTATFGDERWQRQWRIGASIGILAVIYRVFDTQLIANGEMKNEWLIDREE